MYDVRDGNKYIKLVKARSYIPALLQIGTTDDSQKVTGNAPLAKTNVIETIEKAKDDAVKNLIEKSQGDTTKVGLGIDDTRKRSRRNKRVIDLSALPSTIPIELDSIDCDGRFEMRCIVNKPGSRVYMELTQANVEYLRRVVHAQLQEGAVHNQHARTVTPSPISTHTPGVTFSYARNHYRIKLGGKGGQKEKYVKKLADFFASTVTQSSSSIEVDNPQPDEDPDMEEIEDE
jgi:hypothetical protein